MHRYLLATGERCRFYLQHITSRNDQEASLGAGVLDSRTQEPVDEFFENHLARERLRGFNHCREIEMFDRRFDRARWHLRALVLPQSRIELIELPHLSVGSPSQIAGSGLPQISVCDRLEAARRVEAGSQLVGERLVVDEAVYPCRRDGALVELHGLERAPLDTGNLSADERRTIFEVLRTNRRPGPKLLLVVPKRFSVLGIRVRTHRLAASGAR